jgi:hypothetical protein
MPNTQENEERNLHMETLLHVRHFVEESKENDYSGKIAMGISLINAVDDTELLKSDPDMTQFYIALAGYQHLVNGLHELINVEQ